MERPDLFSRYPRAYARGNCGPTPTFQICLSSEAFTPGLTLGVLSHDLIISGAAQLGKYRFMQIYIASLSDWTLSRVSGKEDEQTTGPTRGANRRRGEGPNWMIEVGQINLSNRSFVLTFYELTEKIYKVFLKESKQ